MKNKKSIQEIAHKHALYLCKCRLKASQLVTVEEGVEIITPSRKPHIDKKLVEEIHAKAHEEQQVVINCNYNPFFGPSKMRIWSSTNLFSRDCKRLSKLIKSFNIGIYPNWSFVPPMGTEFTLIFEGKPKDIEVFDLTEVIPEPGEFAIEGIQRNGSDVYNLKIS